MIVVEHKHTFWGPNLYTHLPVIVSEIKTNPQDLEFISEKINKICFFSRQWFFWRGDFNSDLDQNILATFIAEWARAALSEVSGSIEFSKFVTDQDCNLLLLEFHQPELAFHAMEIAAYLVQNADGIDEHKFTDVMNKFWNLCRNKHPDFQIKFLMDYAKSEGIPVFKFLKNSRYWQFGWGCKSKIFFESTPMDDSAIGRQISSDKNLTKQILKNLGLPVVNHVLVNTVDELSKAVDSLGYPLVVKPLDRGRSIGVSVNVTDFLRLELGFQTARKETQNLILIEK
jgi:cyanophycin synthetase